MSDLPYVSGYVDLGVTSRFRNWLFKSIEPNSTAKAGDLGFLGRAVAAYVSQETITSGQGSGYLPWRVPTIFHHVPPSRSGCALASGCC